MGCRLRGNLAAVKESNTEHPKKVLQPSVNILYSDNKSKSYNAKLPSRRRSFVSICVSWKRKIAKLPGRRRNFVTVYVEAQEKETFMINYFHRRQKRHLSWLSQLDS